MYIYPLLILIIKIFIMLATGNSLVYGSEIFNGTSLGGVGFNIVNFIGRMGNIFAPIVTTFAKA